MSLAFAALSAALFFNASPIYDVKVMIDTGQCDSYVPLPWIALFGNAFLWSTYGVLIRQLVPLVACNSVGVLTSTAALVTFMRYNRESKRKKRTYRMIRYLAISVVLVLLLCASDLLIAAFTEEDVSTSSVNSLGILGTCVNMFMFSSPLAEFREVLRSRSTKGISPIFTCASFLCAILWFSLGVEMGDPYIVVSNAVGLLMSSMQLWLFARFGCPKNEIDEKVITVSPHTPFAA